MFTCIECTTCKSSFDKKHRLDRHINDIHKNGQHQCP